MPVLYSTTDHHVQLLQPQVQRFRSRYRGPRESSKTNLEISQITYDIIRLYTLMNDLDTTLDEHITIFDEGGDPTGPSIYSVESTSWSELEGLTWGDLSTQTWGEVSTTPEDILGLDDLAGRIQELCFRVAQLERA
jgi:hypothetical protein